MGPDRGRQAMAAIGLLADELRQRLYRFVAAQPRPVTWDQAAAAAGISRKLAAFHLDKLVAGAAGSRDPRPGQPPPGLGRAPRPTSARRTRVTVSMPERRYDALSELLAACGYESARAAVQLVLRTCPSSGWPAAPPSKSGPLL